MFNKENFNLCLEQGKRYEQETIKYLDYDEFRYSLGKCKEWDIEIIKDNIKTLIEIKADFLASKTGNIAIEYEYNGTPSGINATNSTIWFLYVIKDDIKKEYDLYKVPTDYIKQLIKDKKYFLSCRGGDFKMSKMFLFRKSVFDNYKIHNL
jgi:hypothetical protein